MKHPKQEDPPCDDLVITSKISRLCHGQNKCSVLADPVGLAIMGSGTIIKQSLVCHKNNSALRTTSACVDQEVFSSVFINKFSTSTKRPLTIPGITPTIQLLIPVATGDLFQYFTTPKPSLNISNGLEEIEAKPLEPKPAIIDVLKNDVEHSSNLAEVFSQSKSNNNF